MIDLTINKLKSPSSEKYKNNIVKMGIPAQNTLGVPMPELRKIAGQIPKNSKSKERIKEFWFPEYHECKIIGTSLMTKLNYSTDDIVWYMDQINSWDLCDLFCKTVLIHSKKFDFYIFSWIADDRLYFKRAACTLNASMSTHSVLSPSEIKGYLALILAHAADNRLLIKKSASWALR